MRKTLLFMLVFFSTNVFAEELFVSYLKPYNKKNEIIEQKTRTKKRDPMAEPVIIQQHIIKQKNLLIDKLFSLKAILYNPNSKKAFINNNLYTEGEEIEGYKIKSISNDSVILSKDGKDFELKIE